MIGGGISRPFLFLLINLYLAIGLVLLYLIIRQSIKLIVERRKKVPGSAFKRNLFLAFFVFSVIPVVSIFFIAGKLITTSIDNWFDVRLGQGLENGLLLHEQQTEQERREIGHVGTGLFKALQKSQDKLSFLNQTSKNQSNQDFKSYKLYLWKNNGGELVGSIRDEVRVWRKFRKVNDRTTQSLRESFFNHINLEQGEVKTFDFFGSLYWACNVGKAFGYNNCLLVLVHRYPDHIRYPLIEIQNALSDYSQLKSMRHPIYWSYLLVFLLMTLIILFLSIWAAMHLARGISKPIQDLLLAIRSIRHGDWSVRVPAHPGDDLQHLVVGFNEMTISLQRAYQQLEFQNQEMLTMLEHIKESVFFINNFGRILTFNAASKRLIHKHLSISRFKNKRVGFLGARVRSLFFTLVRDLRASEKNYLTKEIVFSHGGEQKTFLIYMTVVKNAFAPTRRSSQSGLLVIIEDLSEVYKINKIKTWREAAKQMAHEIKNPLTPIQLATQRMQRKLRKRDGDHPDGEDPVLMECTDTILHQVKIIKNLVAHFSEFARMPESVIQSLDINKIIKEVVLLYEMSYPEILFECDLHDFLPTLRADKNKLKRVIINLLDNSVRALQKTNGSHRDGGMHARVAKQVSIKTRFKTNRNQIELRFSDNGPGIPKDVRDSLFLPYVSSGKKNMGLGLAIVHDIVSQTGGTVKLLSSDEGAAFQVLLPV
ncbi:HAMP domain-containing protein [Candidatus Babeliales bacterium]|nr:HAMP domain-containing protein [Candidatus Babeliales bacterium]